MDPEGRVREFRAALALLAAGAATAGFVVAPDASTTAAAETVAGAVTPEPPVAAPRADPVLPAVRPLPRLRTARRRASGTPPEPPSSVTPEPTAPSGDAGDR